jgi:polar amino acid transport system ATP-binding protein
MKIGLRGVSKSFGHQRVLDALEFDLSFEHALALVGPSGGGKSTLLRLLAGLDVPDSGGIFVNGERIGGEENILRLYRKKIGMVFQAFNLFPHLTALENVVLPLVHVHGIGRAEATERARDVLCRFELQDHEKKHPGQLSGGQRQRVAIARALAPNPDFLLLDEPTSALDPEMTSEVLDVIGELRQAGTPIILVTHEMGFARRTADFVAFVARGGIQECAPPEDFFENPQSEETRRFLAKILKY